MEAIALIVEYNPFHNGHLHHIEKAKALFPDAVIICILNGNFLQRGEPSIIDKYTRTKWALAAGVDLVLELPFAFGSQRADVFATAAVRIAASYQAKAIVYGVEQALPLNCDLDLLAPNQKLAYFYQKAIDKYAPSIKAIPIQRKHSEYNATTIEHTSIASATAIRKKFFDLEENDINDFVPTYVSEDLQKNLNHLVHIEQYFPYLKYTLTMQNNPTALAQFGLSENIYKNLETIDSYSEFFAAIHHKHTSKTHIQRVLTYLLCQVEQKTLDTATDHLWTRILGISQKGQKYLRMLKQNDAEDYAIPTIQKLNNLDKANYDLQYKSLIAYCLLSKRSIHKSLLQENSSNIIIQ